MKDIYNIREAAEYLVMSERHLKRLLLEGKIKAFKLGETSRSHWRIKKEELLKFINR